MSKAFSKRVLVLHGYAQNANIFSKRIAGLRKQAKDIDMVIVDAPHILKLEDLFEDSEVNDDPGHAARGWWKFTDPAKTVCVGMEETLLFLRDLLKEKRFDGVFGFSQGAGLACLLSAILERPDSYPGFLIDDQPVHPPFEFCISAAGFKSRDPISSRILNEGFSTPTLHIVGKADHIISLEYTQSILDVSRNKRIEEHDGGHFIPSKAPWRKFLIEWMRKGPEGDVPSPGAETTSAAVTPAASGTATPVGDGIAVATPPISAPGNSDPAS
ncbi:Family of serine hydrolases 3 [Stygiomarasmius scandens]|uniref:Family of serine hydrolases 3 n=1 Tax=Marasmiellus scandens TaxID=2682957 RepID=A0ABR1JK53_9AGAR